MQLVQKLLCTLKLILLLATPPRLKICACALCVIFIVTSLDKRDKEFNTTQC